MVEPIRQESFWDRPLRKIETPAARATDPDTSHIAAAEHTASGKRGTIFAIVVVLVRARPGHTSAELARYTDLTRHEVARRLPEGETAGAIRKGEKRRCAVNGTLAMTWWPQQ
jgi:CRP-like cAMP-binding protein